MTHQEIYNKKVLQANLNGAKIKNPQNNKTLSININNSIKKVNPIIKRKTNVNNRAPITKTNNNYNNNINNNNNNKNKNNKNISSKSIVRNKVNNNRITNNINNEDASSKVRTLYLNSFSQLNHQLKEQVDIMNERKYAILANINNLPMNPACKTKTINYNSLFDYKSHMNVKNDCCSYNHPSNEIITRHRPLIKNSVVCCDLQGIETALDAFNTKKIDEKKFMELMNTNAYVYTWMNEATLNVARTIINKMDISDWDDIGKIYKRINDHYINYNELRKCVFKIISKLCPVEGMEKLLMKINRDTSEAALQLGNLWLNIYHKVYTISVFERMKTNNDNSDIDLIIQKTNDNYKTLEFYGDYTNKFFPIKQTLTIDTSKINHKKLTTNLSKELFDKKIITKNQVQKSKTNSAIELNPFSIDKHLIKKAASEFDFYHFIDKQLFDIERRHFLGLSKYNQSNVKQCINNAVFVKEHNVKPIKSKEPQRNHVNKVEISVKTDRYLNDWPLFSLLMEQL